MGIDELNKGKVKLSMCHTLKTNILYRFCNG